MGVTEAYLLGIREGRAAMNAAIGSGIDRAEYLRSEMATLRPLKTQGFSGDMREMFRGQLDFVTNQLFAKNAPRAALSRAVNRAIANGAEVVSEIKA